MAMYCGFFGPTRVDAAVAGDTGRLRIEDAGGSSFAIFMPMEQAQAMADAFNNPARITALECFVADFAATDFPAIRPQGCVHPEDVEDEVTELAPIEAWQEDARALINPKPAIQEAAE